MVFPAFSFYILANLVSKSHLILYKDPEIKKMFGLSQQILNRRKINAHCQGSIQCWWQNTTLHGEHQSPQNTAPTFQPSSLPLLPLPMALTLSVLAHLQSSPLMPFVFLQVPACVPSSIKLSPTPQGITRCFFFFSCAECLAYIG